MLENNSEPVTYVSTVASRGLQLALPITCCLYAFLQARYGTVQGYSSFRRCLAAFLSDATHHTVDPEELLITAGEPSLKYDSQNLVL
jgi:hypothetical protein